ncbi:MAG: ATPase [Thermoprotei archaeon]|nr:MAG: ATPase [Thermoprotei archaeon]
MPAVIVNKPVEMLYVTLLLPRSKVDEALNILHEAGAVHVEKLGERVEEYLRLYERMNKLYEKVLSLLNMARGVNVDVKLTRQEMEMDLEYIEKDVDKVYSEVEALSNRKKELEEQLRKLKDVEEALSMLPGEFRIRDMRFRGKYLSSLTLRGRTESIEQLLKAFRGVYSIYTRREEHTAVSILVYPTNIEGELLSAIGNLGLSLFELPKPLESLAKRYTRVSEFLASVRELIESHAKEAREVEERVGSEIRSAVNDLAKYLVILENRINRLKALLATRHTKYLFLLGGWVPRDRVNDLIQALRRRGIPFYYEAREPVKGVDEPPTLLKNPPVIEWYEPIVKFFGMPRYWEWDPTPIVAYSFALFYGIMLGDMGYAIAIILAALFLLDKFVADPRSRDYLFFKRALIVSSIVGFAVGFLGGSFLGFQIYTLTDVFVDPLKFLVIALIIGLIHVNISHALTLIKGIREKLVGEVLSEAGLFVAELAGIPYVMYTMLNTPIPGIPTWIYDYLLYIAFAGVAMIVVGMLKSIGVLGLLLWIFNLTGLLGDVLSYSRLAGVGMATIFLGASFNTMAILAYEGLKALIPVEAAALALGGIIAGFIMLFGHLLNTALSALGGFVHSLRLCFIEFLSKFYEGTGYPFEPLRIVLSKRVVIE